MQLIKNGQKVDADSWTYLADADAAPGDGDVIVSLARFQDERDALLARNGGLGVKLNSDETPEAIADDLDQISLIALDFPIYRDGRHFTSARKLRERYGYEGEVRAVGDVLRDQIGYMVRVGFDAFEVKKDHDAEDFAKAVNEFRHAYQVAQDGQTIIAEKRQKDSGACAA